MGRIVGASMRRVLPIGHALAAVLTFATYLLQFTRLPPIKNRKLKNHRFDGHEVSELFIGKYRSMYCQHSEDNLSNQYSLTTNLADLQHSVQYRLAEALDYQSIWTKLIDKFEDSPFHLSIYEFDRISRADDSANALLLLLGNRGQTVHSLLKRLHALSKIFGSVMDAPQLTLRRKFVPVFWSRPEEISVRKAGNEKFLELVCHAKGFPNPQYVWRKNGEIIGDVHGKSLIILRCFCNIAAMFSCQVSNEVADGMEYSSFYRQPNKQFESQITSVAVDVGKFFIDGGDTLTCDRCAANHDISELHEKTNSDAVINKGFWDEQSVAADKVALIISNCNYEYLPHLITPHCDAELLAHSLQKLGFKTVTLGDLNRDEMEYFINKYKKLLGGGVYAVFYFVGHGFEVNGKSYLLPVNISNETCRQNDCIALDEILRIFDSASPALNLILLDICRKELIFDSAFIDHDSKRSDAFIARNTICGYATSSGVSAFEVLGERNGVFMKYLQKHITKDITVLEMLTQTFQDISSDQKVSDLQVPELRSNVTLPRSLGDPLIYEGHTASFNYHTLHWRYLHELPHPINIRFDELALTVIVWYDFAGHFTNKAYVFSSVEHRTSNESPACNVDSKLLSFVAHLRFPEFYHASSEKLIEDGTEGISLCVMLSNIQRSKGPIRCSIDLTRYGDKEVVATRENIVLGDVLITRIYQSSF